MSPAPSFSLVRKLVTQDVTRSPLSLLSQAVTADMASLPHPTLSPLDVLSQLYILPIVLLETQNPGYDEQ